MSDATTRANPLRKTKIIATLGPATDELAACEELIAAGVNLVRVNCSHGTHEAHAKRIQQVRDIAKQQGCVVGVLVDLQGPKIRIARFQSGSVTLSVGDSFTLDASLGEADGDANRVGIDYKSLPADVSAGDTLLLDDGRIELQVNAVSGEEIQCEVVTGGVLSDNKGINRLGGGLSAEALTDKDRTDLDFAIAQGADYVALSFPREANDILTTKDLIRAAGAKAGVIAKIERAEAVDNLIDIIQASDGVMVARGDLALEIGEEEVPFAQKHIIHEARCHDKPVIVATQMMESMIENTVATRAEVSDVAHAVLDNVDAVMLSAESAVGKHPALVVEKMSRICLAVESKPQTHVSKHRLNIEFKRVDESIAMATMYTANHLDIDGILALTESGTTPLWMSRMRTGIPIFGLSREAATLGRMSLFRGVYPVLFDITSSTRDSVNKDAVDCLVARGDVLAGQRLILTKGDFLGVGGGSNAMKILTVGEVV